MALFVLNQVSWAQGNESFGDEKELVRSALARLDAGVPASSEPVQKNLSLGKAESDLADLEGRWRGISVKGASCERFVHVANALIGDLQSGLNTLSLRSAEFAKPLSAHDFEFINHLRIAAASLAELHFLLQNKAEGGYSVLDPHIKSQCVEEGRAEITAAVTTTLDDLSRTFELVLGVPSLWQMEQSQQRVLQLMLDDAKIDRSNFLKVMVAGTVVSVVFWEFGPAICAGAVRALWGYTPRIFAVPAFLYGIKGSAIVAEGLAFSYADTVTSSQTSPPKIMLGTWEEHMKSIETFVAAPIHSPELELAYLTRIHAMVAAESEQWIVNYGDLLREENGLAPVLPQD